MKFKFVKEIVSQSPDLGDRFGHIIKGRDGNIIISAHYDDYFSNNGGLTYHQAGSVFCYNSDGEGISSIRNSIPVNEGKFGIACALAKKTLLIAEYLPVDEVHSMLHFFDISNIAPLISIPVPRSMYYDRVLDTIGEDCIYAHQDGMVMISADPDSPDFGAKICSFTAKQQAYQSVYVSPKKHIFSGNPFNKSNGRIGKVYMYDGDRLSRGFGKLMGVFEDPRNKEGSQQFGWHMIVLGDILFVSSYTDSTNGYYQSGAVHLFDANPDNKNFGQFITTIENPNPLESTRFGLALATIHDKLVVSSPTSPHDPNIGGQVYVMNVDLSSNDFGSIYQTIPKPQHASKDFRFGHAIKVIDNETLLVSTTSKGGRVFLYKASAT